MAWSLFGHVTSTFLHTWQVALSSFRVAEAVEQTIEELDKRGGEIPIIGFLAALINGVALTFDEKKRN